MKKKVFIGVAWPYVNGELHVGHLAGFLLPADICSRYNHLVGNEVLMASGSDCYGTPITVEADKRNVKPIEIVNKYHKKMDSLFKDTLGLSYDIYTQTNTPHHTKVVQDIFIKLLEEGYIIVDSMKQYYSKKDKKFLPDRYVTGTCPHCGLKDARSDQCDQCGKLFEYGELVNPKSNLNKESVVLKKTEHYFLDWKKLQPKIEEYVKESGRTWKKWVYKETLGWLKEGLKPRAISRDIDWGVPIPINRIPKSMLIKNAKDKKFYVWFDAVIGYLSASTLWAKMNNKEWKPFWYGKNVRHYYFMGKDNLIFHTIFWPGKLMIYDHDLHLPDLVSINMFLNFDGKQFSKSRGVVIGIEDIVNKFGNDRVRFYLTSVMPETKDSSFNWDDFKEKINGVLVANLGNFIHRTLSIGHNMDKTELEKHSFDIDVINTVSKSFTKAKLHLDQCEFRNYLNTLLDLSDYGNKYFNNHKIWIVKKEDRAIFYSKLKQLQLIVISLGYLMQPLLPDAGEKLFKNIGLDIPESWPRNIKNNTKFLNLVNKINLNSRPVALFQKVEETDYL